MGEIVTVQVGRVTEEGERFPNVGFWDAIEKNSGGVNGMRQLPPPGREGDPHETIA
jgi:hypothetical protein